MNQNLKYQTLAILFLIIFLWGILIVPKYLNSVQSYMVGSFLMYLMCNMVYTKLKLEVKENV